MWRHSNEYKKGRNDCFFGTYAVSSHWRLLCPGFHISENIPNTIFYFIFFVSGYEKQTI